MAVLNCFAFSWTYTNSIPETCISTLDVSNKLRPKQNDEQMTERQTKKERRGRPKGVREKERERKKGGE